MDKKDKWFHDGFSKTYLGEKLGYQDRTFNDQIVKIEQVIKEEEEEEIKKAKEQAKKEKEAKKKARKSGDNNDSSYMHQLPEKSLDNNDKSEDEPEKHQTMRSFSVIESRANDDGTFQYLYDCEDDAYFDLERVYCLRYAAELHRQVRHSLYRDGFLQNMPYTTEDIVARVEAALWHLSQHNSGSHAQALKKFYMENSIKIFIYI